MSRRVVTRSRFGNRRLAAAVAFLALSASAPLLWAQGAPPRQEKKQAQAKQAAPIDPAKMEWLLGEWEKQSTQLKTLDVTILRIDDNPAWGDLDYYEGRALFQSPNLAFIDFKKIKQDDDKKPVMDAKGKYVSAPHERIICTGNEVWQYKSDTKQIFIFPLQEDESKKAIEEGPLPFLFNMRADDAKRRYEMTLLTDDEEGGTYGVKIKPKLPEDKESFSLAFVNLDRRYLLPVRIIMISPDGKLKKDFRLDPVAPNKKIPQGNFVGTPLKEPWTVIRNPTGEERPRAGMTRGGGAARPANPAAARLKAGAVQR